MTRATLSAIFTVAVIATGGPSAPTTSTVVGGVVAFSRVTCPGRRVLGGASFPCGHRLPVDWPGHAPEVRVVTTLGAATGRGPVVRCARCGGLVEIT